MNLISENKTFFLFQGHDTSGMTLSYAVLLIAEHADAQVSLEKKKMMTHCYSIFQLENVLFFSHEFVTKSLKYWTKAKEN